VNHKLQEKNTLYVPDFVDSWDEQSLYPLADWVNGMAFKDFNFTPKGKPVIKIAEIKNGISSQTKFTDGQYNEVYLLNKGDMLFCWSGQPQTSIDIFWWDGPEGWLNQHIFKVIPKTENKIFFYYLLKYLKPNFVQIAINKQTTGLGHVTKGDLERFIVKLPSPNEQREIGAVMASLDNKIDLLQEQNKTLEVTAQKIFKEWFVNFNFPGGTGKMIDSEMNKIPDGWKVGKLGEVIEFINGYAFKSSDLLEQEVEDCYKVFKMGNIKKGGGFDFFKTKSFIKKNQFKNIDKYILKKGDILMSMTDMKDAISLLGHTALMIYDNEYIVNQRVGLIRPLNDLNIDYPFLYLLTNNEDFISNLRSRANSGVQVNLSTDSIKNCKFVIADRKTNNNFNELVKPLFNKMEINEYQIQTLSSIRDILLPKLMKGEIRIRDFNN